MSKVSIAKIKKLKKEYKVFIKEMQQADPNVRKDFARSLIGVATADLRILGILEDIIRLNEKQGKKQCQRNK